MKKVCMFPRARNRLYGFWWTIHCPGVERILERETPQLGRTVSLVFALASVLGIASFSEAATTNLSESPTTYQVPSSVPNDADSLPAHTHPSSGAVASLHEPRIGRQFSFGIRGSFVLRENDLKLTTDSFPNFAAGLFLQYQPSKSHRLRLTGEWWDFSSGVQHSQQTSRTQTINTKVRAIVAGGEYLYRLPGPLKRLSVGGGAYFARWSVHSVDSVTLIPGGTTQATGTSQWNRLGEGPTATFRLSRWFEIEGRWIHSDYGYEHLPMNVFTLGSGWRF